MVTKLMKSKWFPRPHNYTINFGMGLETGVANQATIIPVIMHDEGLGDPTSYEANPENASFAEAPEPNCYPESRVNKVFVQLRVFLTKDALETDKVKQVRFCYMPIFTSFKEDLTAIDELTANEVQDLLELQSESTDRQTYPLWTGVDMPIPYVTPTLPTNVPGLTTDQTIEGVTFGYEAFYDALQYYTNRGKLKQCQRGLKWVTLTPEHSFVTLRFAIDSKVKRINEYAFMGIFIGLPPAGTRFQNHVAADTTNITHLGVFSEIRFNEWNEHFNMRKV